MNNAVMPGTIIKNQMEARGWTQKDLAFILGRQQSEISGLIAGKRPITLELAHALATVFETDALYWINLEIAYRVVFDEEAVTKRLNLYGRYPVREMLKRGWIEPDDSLEVLEKRVCDFLGIKTLDETPKVEHAALKSTPYTHVTSAQSVWIARVRQLAQYVQVSKFSDNAHSEALERLRLLLKDPEEIRHVPRILADAGIRFVLAEALPTTRIDGVTTWFDNQSPIIGLSMRFDRINAFWHVLAHEMDHVKHREGQTTPLLDVDLVDEGSQPAGEIPKTEQRANAFASNFTVKKADIDNFIARIRPLYSKQRIQAFAARMMVHPGIVVGQLQHKGEIPYSHHRETLVKVRHLLSDSAITDGWGYKPSIKQGSRLVA